MGDENHSGVTVRSWNGYTDETTGKRLMSASGESAHACRIPEQKQLPRLGCSYTLFSFEAMTHENAST